MGPESIQMQMCSDNFMGLHSREGVQRANVQLAGLVEGGPTEAGVLGSGN